MAIPSTAVQIAHDGGFISIAFELELVFVVLIHSEELMNI